MIKFFVIDRILQTYKISELQMYLLQCIFPLQRMHRLKKIRVFVQSKDRRRTFLNYFTYYLKLY